jgi:hypothetical protein
LSNLAKMASFDKYIAYDPMPAHERGRAQNGNLDPPAKAAASTTPARTAATSVPSMVNRVGA